MNWVATTLIVLIATSGLQGCGRLEDKELTKLDRQVAARTEQLAVFDQRLAEITKKLTFVRLLSAEDQVGLVWPFLGELRNSLIPSALEGGPAPGARFLIGFRGLSCEIRRPAHSLLANTIDLSIPFVN